MMSPRGLLQAHRRLPAAASLAPPSHLQQLRRPAAAAEGAAAAAPAWRRRRGDSRLSTAAPPHNARQQRQRCAAAAPETLEAETEQESLQQQQQQQQQAPSVEFLGVLRDMQTVRGVLATRAPPELVFAILTDYDSCARVFRNISGSQTLEPEGGGKQVVQACKWQFLAFKGTFNVALNVSEDAAQRLLVFTLAESSFMRDFEGRWKVEALTCGGSRIEHVLAVKPLVSIPAAVAPYTSTIFKQQVAALLDDLAAEVERQAAGLVTRSG